MNRIITDIKKINEKISPENRRIFMIYFRNKIMFWLKAYTLKTILLFLTLSAILFFAFSGEGYITQRFQFAILTSLWFSFFISALLFVYSNIYRDFEMRRAIKNSYLDFLIRNNASQIDITKYHMEINTFSVNFYLIKNKKRSNRQFSACFEFYADTNDVHIENFYHYCAFYKLKPDFHFWPGIILAKFPAGFDSNLLALEIEKIINTFYQSGIRSIQIDLWYEYYLDYFLDNYHASTNLFDKKFYNSFINQKEIQVAD